MADTPKKRFDYIIVGAGAAGCVLANRLSAHPNSSVLLLEAGALSNHWRLRMPMAAMDRLSQSDKFCWKNWSEPEAQLDGRRIYVPSGRVIGGSSSINGMVHIRGNPAEFDRWAEQGCDGWSYQDVLPYFRKSESYHGPSSPLRGSDGPLSICKTTPVNPLDVAFIDSGVEAGFGLSEDFNGASQEGFGSYDHSIDGGQRVSAATAYLYPAQGRSNLTVISNARVEKIRIEAERAVAVAYQKNSQSHWAFAESEVIVCAGAIWTPHLLQRSGIGHADRLREAGVEPNHHIPAVGHGLQNHIDVVLQYACKEPVSILNMTKPWNQIAQGLRWFQGGGGYYGTCPFVAGALFKSSDTQPYPDIQVIFTPCATEPASQKPRRYHGFQAHIGLQKYSTKGSVQLKSTDPRIGPEIRFNLFEEPDDQQRLVYAIRHLEDVFRQPAFKAYCGERLLPGPDVESDDDLKTWLTFSAGCAHHSSASCPMGSPDKESSVVDSECRVIGLEGLRVVDASVMPAIVNSNTHATVVMIAEKAADMIMGREL